ncbi:unnamed protein product [Symbiodinium natans]|uniref:5-hmdU DNA kinase helical domain-containing protein n=1 Tax=Symbiodinium natans TaxID=878477 RepID=A0A812QV69_9DINO|nr:unnamed protein product [Symbiodinium natans]
MEQQLQQRLLFPSPELDSEVEPGPTEYLPVRPKKRRLDGDVAPHSGKHHMVALQAQCSPRQWTACSPRWKQRRNEVEPPEKACSREFGAAGTVNSVGVKDFYDFMRRREGLRRRREVLRLPPEHWTNDHIMARIRLTNVKREDDRTTRVMRKLCNAYVDQHPELKELRKIPPHSWDFNLRLSARCLVFNFALWRAFGTDAFAESIGFLTHKTWSNVEQDAVVEAAKRRWSMGLFNYTDAYDPSRSHRAEELQARTHEGLTAVHRVYSRTCASLAGLWRACDDIAERAVTSSSWRNVTRCVMKVPGYGGTGFLAKELVQDLLHTPLFETWNSQQSKWVCGCTDLNSWCAVGPGARRGLNRLHGRRVNWNAYCDDAEIAQQFFVELCAVFRERDKYWHGNLEGSPVFELELHDVQFQLCELDKYERERKQPGHVRAYQPPKTWDSQTDASEAARAPLEACRAQRAPAPPKPSEARSLTRGRQNEVVEDLEEEKHEKRLSTALDIFFAEVDRNVAQQADELEEIP